MSNFSLLPHRCVIRVDGADSKSFLQGLISNDINKASEEQLVYAFMLTPQGKYFADFFITLEGQGYLIDAPAENSEQLLKRLNMYKLRSNVVITLQSMKVAISDDGFVDPRNSAMPKRSLVNDALVDEAMLSKYHYLRMKHKLAEGMIDIPFEGAFILHYGAEQMNGVSYTKGCYVGQEVTARMHHRDAVRKALFVLQGDYFEPGLEVKNSGEVVGKTLSFSGDLGLALLTKLDFAESSHLTINNNSYKIYA